MDNATITEIINYLNTEEYDNYEQVVLRLRIKHVFDITEEQAKKAYLIWKCEYMKQKH